MLQKKILNVSYQDKDTVKQLGAKWDPNQKVWYVPVGKEASVFSKWLAPPVNKAQIVISSIGLVRNITPCWSCKGYCTVCAIYARHIVVPESKNTSATEKQGFFILSEIASMPDDMANFISLRCVNYRLGKVSETGERLYRNHCDHCAIGLSDVRLHKKNKGFNPASVSHCKNIQCIDLLFFDNLKIHANYIDYSDHELLLNFATQSDYLTDFV